MAYVNVLISNAARLSFKNNNLVIKQDEEVTIPLDDINIIVVESLEVNISSYLISECAQRNIPILFCNQKHLPIGLLNSFYKHSRQLKRIQEQLSQTTTFKKKIWLKILKAKIRNQAIVLKLKDKQDIAQEILNIKISQISQQQNLEGIIANKYFQALLGENFKRDQDTFQNAFLNYGYAIIRSMIAQTIAFYGFIPALGVYHKNEYNNFNLADDFIEPYRPIVDLLLTDMIKYPVALDKNTKQILLNIPFYEVIIKRKKVNIRNAIDIMIKSYVTAIKKKKASYLVLPKVTELKIKSYE